MVLLLAFALSTPSVQTMRVPNGGIQPQAVRGDDGTVHMIYFTGDPAAGDIHYVSSKDDGRTWSKDMLVSAYPNFPHTAIALGNIRGGQIAIGPDGTVAVVWNGTAESGYIFSKVKEPPVLLAVLKPGAKAFKPAGFVARAYALDGGATVAIDGQGKIGVFFHDQIPDGKGESDRSVWYVAGDAKGEKFAPRKRLDVGPLGACACCSVKAIGEDKGFTVLYRSATQSGNDTNRDTWRIAVDEDGAAKAERLDPWKLNYCPMSSFSLVRDGGRTWSAWETAGSVRFGDKGAFTALLASGSAKHPALACSGGYILCAWTEGMTWGKGGKLRWSVLDRSRKVVETSEGSLGEVPAWSLVTAFARKDGGFTVVY